MRYLRTLGALFLAFALLPSAAQATPGTCGSANGASFATKPTIGLCSYGTPSSVSGSGPWSWTCNAPGHSPTPCGANLSTPPVNGQCGSSDGKTLGSKPTIGLCSAGTASSVSGSGPWTWECAGSNGGTTDECSADKTAPPACGNGTKESGEACDDGNSKSGDGCSSQCRVESCGDGSVDVGESCDDGNTQNGDGCSAACKTETKDEPKKDDDDDDEKCDGSIGNYVWHDANGDGAQDKNEAGIAGVEVWLYHGDDIEKERTGQDGKYEFDDLCEGSYRVVVKAETVGGKNQTADPDDKRDHMTEVSLDDDEHHAKADFGYKGLIAPATGPGPIALAASAATAIVAVAVIVKMLGRRKLSGKA